MSTANGNGGYQRSGVRAAASQEGPTEHNARLLPTRRCRLNHKLFLYFLVTVAAIGGGLFGYDTGVVSGAMLLISDEFGLSAWQHEVVVSCTIAMAAIGSLCSDSMNRLYGRRPVLLAASVVFVAGSVVLAVASSFETLVLGRMVVGIAVGLASSTVPMFIAELAPPERRGQLVTLNSVCIILGQVIATLVAGAFGGVDDGWRYMLGLGAVPAAIQFLGLLLLPESPRWLLSMGREAQARRVLRRLFAPGSDQEDKVDAEIKAMLDNLIAEGSALPVRAPASSLECCADGVARTDSRQPPVAAVTEAAAEAVEAAVEAAMEAGTVEAAAESAAATVTATATATATAMATATATATATDMERDRPAVPPDAKGGAREGANGRPVERRMQIGASPTAAIETRASSRRRVRGVKCDILTKLWKVRRQLELGVALQLLQQLVGINTIMYYSGSILQQSFYGRGEPTDEQRQVLIWLTAPVATAQLLGCLCGMRLIDLSGRKTLALASLAGIAVTLALEGAAFGLDEWMCLDHADSAPRLCAAVGWVSLSAMAAYLIAFGVGMAPVPWLVNAEIFPLDVRSTCVGIATAANWTANLVVAASFLSLQEAVSRPATFWIYGLCACVGALYLALRMPETANKSLEEIEGLFERGPRARVGPTAEA